MEVHQQGDRDVAADNAIASAAAIFVGPAIVVLVVSICISYFISWVVTSAISGLMTWLAYRPETTGITQAVTYDQAWSQVGLGTWIVSGLVVFVVLVVLCAAVIDTLYPTPRKSY